MVAVLRPGKTVDGCSRPVWALLSQAIQVWCYDGAAVEAVSTKWESEEDQKHAQCSISGPRRASWKHNAPGL